MWIEHISIDMFEQEWASIMDEFDLGSNKFLCDIYKMRHRWIPAFLCNDDMFGLMRTTSRSESKNWYFNRFTNPDLTLVEFIRHFKSAMDIQRCYIVHLILYLLAHANVMKLYGLLCWHIFYVLRMNSVKEFPVEYVLVRWKKYSDNVWANAYVVLCQSSSEAGIREIRWIVKDTVDRLVHFKDKLDFHRLELPDLLAKAKFDVLVLMRVNKQDTFCLMLGSAEPKRVVIKLPRHSNNKGIGSHSRWKNMDELVQNEAESSKKRRTCFSYGKAEGHNSRTCPYKDTINASNKRVTSSTRSLIVDYKE
nr:hypothetical protein [Tanacetum cinerariifolium]